ncbi:MAG: 16S rRNA processing protein RimM [Pyrinomonadaceae bacterium]|nr:16S rRNA processing protein RimM [Pyrinomonadaceae bacterium]
MNKAENSEIRDDLVAVARIAKPKGLKGEVVADLLTDFPERFENLERVLAGENGERELGIERFSFHKSRIVLKFAGVDSIEEAETLRNLYLCVRESEVVALEEGEFYDWELEGCEVVTGDGDRIGRVKEIFRAGENVNLVVAGKEREHMIPFVEAICIEVDIDLKRIVVDLPEGLLEF